MKAFDVIQDAQRAEPCISYTQRIKRLKTLRKVLKRDRQKLVAAIRNDFERCAFEVLSSDYLAVMGELNHTIKHLHKWMRPKRVARPIALLGSTAEIHPMAKGSVLVIGTWNYSFNITLKPLISAWAAGNRVIIKPSEWTPTASHLLANIIAEVFDPSEVTVVEGDAEVSKTLVDLPFNHIYFTGGGRVGRLIGSSAVARGISCTLELGGKGPAIIDNHYSAKKAARRISWAKLTNSGQTCIGVDHVLCPEERKEEVIAALVKEFKRRYRKKQNTPMVHGSHFERVRAMLEEAKELGAECHFGGEWDVTTRQIVPCILSGVTEEMRIDQEEIFGAILPVYTYEDEDELLAHLRRHRDPLAAYLFSKRQAWLDRILPHLRAGGVTINDTFLHQLNPNLPFGGVGLSGLGATHGEFGFRELSHLQARAIRRWPGVLRTFMPPYSWYKRWLQGVLARFPSWL